MHEGCRCIGQLQHMYTCTSCSIAQMKVGPLSSFSFSRTLLNPSLSFIQIPTWQLQTSNDGCHQCSAAYTEKLTAPHNPYHEQTHPNTVSHTCMPTTLQRLHQGHLHPYYTPGQLHHSTPLVNCTILHPWSTAPYYTLGQLHPYYTRTHV